MAFKLASVGGERQFVQVACLQMPPKAAHQIVDTAPDERLAPCQPQATDAPSYEGGGDAVDLLQAQHLGARHEAHRLAHAVKIGRPSGRERVCRVGENTVVAVDIKKQKYTTNKK